MRIAASGVVVEGQGQASESDARVRAAFRRAAANVPAYRTLLAEAGVDPAVIVDRKTFAAHCPVLSKSNTFDRFPIDALCADGVMGDLAEVLTSSGHGGRFSFGLNTRRQKFESAAMIDYALDQAFSVKTRRTLAINCLPMGVTFSSNCMTVATTSVREDMAVSLVRTFGSRHDQIVIVTDPLFARRLLDHAHEQGLDWSRYRVNVVLGEEVFGEYFRSYVAGRLGLDLDRPDTGYIISSFGVGELGLHLCFETPSTIALRRAALENATLSRDLFGNQAGSPMVLAFNPDRTLMEALDPDPDGFGRLTVSMLDCELPLPLLRYQPGDVVKLLDPIQVARTAAGHGVRLRTPLPDGLLALRGREKERLPDGSHVAVYKDALYADPGVADRLSGAFRLTPSPAGVRVHVQLARGASSDASFEEALRTVLGMNRGGEVVVSAYGEFPYGMSLDYERKFTYYDAGAEAPARQRTTASGT